MSYFTQVGFSDTGAVDAFTRLRTSAPENLLSIQSQYNAATIQMEAGATGTGQTPAYDANTRMTSVTCTAGSGTSFLQSFQYSPYEPGRSQLIAMTFVLGTGVAGAVVDVGYFDAGNGVIFRQNGVTNLQLILRTSTSGSVSDGNIVNQANWNLDTMGAGALNPSGLTLDVTKAQIMIIDLQYLGMGRVRIGFDINGVIYYVHQFLNANNLSVPYMQTATLPVGLLVTATSTAAPKTAKFKCAAVMSEGGALTQQGYDFSSPETTVTAGNGTRTVIHSIRPKTTFNGITNRELFILRGINLLVTGANPVLWELVIGGAYSGQAFSDVNTSYSAYEYSSTVGSFTNLTGGIVISAGYAQQNAAGGAAHIDIPELSSLRYPISLDRAGAVRALGTMSLIVTGISGTSACRASFDFKEIR